MQVDAFSKEHEVYDFTAADFEQDRETLRQLRAREAQRCETAVLGRSTGFVPGSRLVNCNAL
jgi:hypothetical protein